MMRSCERHIRERGDAGLTLVELLVSATLLAMATAAIAAGASVLLDAYTYGMRTSATRQAGLQAMEQVTARVRTSTDVSIPNAAQPVDDQIAFSGWINEDNDFYFDDPLFPRIDEEPAGDSNADGAPGFSAMDDDGDGSVDEGGIAHDDDEDGTPDEDPLNTFLVWHDGATSLFERDPVDSTDRLISDVVTAFSVTFEEADANHGPRYLISMTLDDGVSEAQTYSEYVFSRNAQQRTGKRVH